MKLLSKVFHNSDRSRTYLGQGVDLEDVAKPIRLHMEDDIRMGHFGCLGTTRIGKTRLMEHIISQDIRKGMNLIVIDPKGDNELFSHIVERAIETGREDDLMLLTPIYPEHSIRLDPLSHYYMPEEIVDHVVSGIQAREEYFINVAYETTLIIVLSVLLFNQIRDEKEDLNFHAVKRRASYPDLVKLKEALRDLNAPDASDILADLEQVISSPQEFFGKVSSSLRTTLTSLTSGSVGEIIGKARANEFIKRLEEGKRVILVVQTGSMLTRKTSHIVGRVLISMIQSLVGRFFASNRKLDPPLCIHIDEGHNVLYLGIQELFNKGGGANCWIHFYTQSIAQMDEAIGRDATKSILDNINTWVIFKVNHPDTAKYVERSTPRVKKFSPILFFGGGISIREIEEPLVTMDRVLRLRPRQFVMISYGRYYRGYTTEVKEPKLSVVFPDVKIQKTE